MYSDRLRVLKKAYRNIDRDNELYLSTKNTIGLYELQLKFLTELETQLKLFKLAVTEEESKWRESILSVLETEIMDALSAVYPTDGYKISLATNVLRGKIHIEASVSSVSSKDIPGRIINTQGRLFQQVVSLAALIGTMSLLGVKTVYIDEAFSGSSKKNIAKLNALLNHYRERGFNLILIVQDTNIADGIPANKLFLHRSLDNRTTVMQEVIEDE